MTDATTDQNFPNAMISIFQKDGVTPAKVDGMPVWASSDETVLSVVPSADGMGAIVDTVAPGTARITVSADADLGAGIMPITGVSEDVVVTMGTAHLASVIKFDLGAPADKSA